MNRLTLLCFLFSVFVLLGDGWGGEAIAFQIQSPVFQDQGNLPEKYTCDGEDVSPSLFWKDAPAGTQSFALIVDDPDAPMGTWVHWVVYDLPGGLAQLEEGIAAGETLASGAKQGMTDFRKVGYGGPCPPAGKPHRYFFKLYALDTVLNLPTKASKADILVAMNGHVLAQAELVGLYQRSG